MRLNIRKGSRIYRVELPNGSRVETTGSGRLVLLVPGVEPGDTAHWLPDSSIVEAARQGRFGLKLREERSLVVC